MFLNDERFPVGDAVMASVEEAKAEIAIRSFPRHVDFDNDLGGELEGRDFARWLVEEDMTAIEHGRLAIPADFTFAVHSQNCVAAEWIRSYLESYLKQRTIPG